jgi:hypothetical protein
MYDIDSDNDEEVINAPLFVWCGERHIRFTRACRAGRLGGSILTGKIGLERSMTSPRHSVNGSWKEAKEERRAGLYNPVRLKISLDRARNRLL